MLIAAAGEAAQRQTLEFFTARLPNAHTREAYGRAVARFCAWCDAHSVELASARRSSPPTCRASRTRSALRA